APRGRRAAARPHRRQDRPCRRALRAGRPGGGGRARGGAVGRLHAAAASLPRSAGARSRGGAAVMTAEQAYVEVERLTRRRARNFAYGIMVLPKQKRRAIAAIYAFAREVDDVADDGALPAAEKRQRLEALREVVDG